METFRDWFLFLMGMSGLVIMVFGFVKFSRLVSANLTGWKLQAYTYALVVLLGQVLVSFANILTK